MTETVTEVARVPFPDAVRALGRVALVGTICGALIGGVGGRLAMMALRFTSGDVVVGLQSDDGFTTGRSSAATLFLIGVTAFLGLAGALLYTVGRGWVPRGWRAAVWGTLCCLFIGADLVSTEGIDFRLLAPRGLAIALFVAIPALYGVAVSLAVERYLPSDGAPGRAAWLGYLPLLAFALLGPPGVVVLAVLLLGCLVWVSVPAFGRLWHSAAVTWLGRIAIVLIALTSLRELVDDARSLLT